MSGWLPTTPRLSLNISLQSLNSATRNSAQLSWALSITPSKKLSIENECGHARDRGQGQCATASRTNIRLTVQNTETSELPPGELAPFAMYEVFAAPETTTIAHEFVRFCDFATIVTTGGFRANS